MRNFHECRRIVRVASWLVPRGQRTEWLQEWQAELWHRWQALPEPVSTQGLRDLRARSWGAFLDAAWLRFNRKDLACRMRRRARTPGFCMTAIVGLIVLFIAGSGFFLETRTVLRPPYADPDNIVMVARNRVVPSTRNGVPLDWVQIWKTRRALIGGIAAYSWEPQRVTLVYAKRRQAIDSLQVEAEFFPVLGVQAALGRAFAPNDDRECMGCVLLSYAAWQEQFHGDPQIVGRTLSMDGRPAVILGVLPQKFWFLSNRIGVWRVLDAAREGDDMPVGAVMRLRSEASNAQVEAYLDDLLYSETHHHFDLEVWGVRERIHGALFFCGLCLAFALLLTVAGMDSPAVRSELCTTHLAPIHRLRWWLFFATKILLLLLLLLAATIEFTAGSELMFSGMTRFWWQSVFLWMFSLGCIQVLWWSVADQQARCRVCMQRLTLPANIGRSGYLLLHWAGTELVCPGGHGVLQIPDTVDSRLAPQQWIRLDESWAGLFNRPQSPGEVPEYIA